MKPKAASLLVGRKSTPERSIADPRTTAQLKENVNQEARLLYQAGRHLGSASAKRRFLSRLATLDEERNRLLVKLGYRLRRSG